MSTNKKSFEFNLKSNGRLPQPMKFEVISEYNAGYKLFNQNDSQLIRIGDIHLFNKENKSRSVYVPVSLYVDYHDLQHPLYGKAFNWKCVGVLFDPKRIHIIQLN